MTDDRRALARFAGALFFGGMYLGMLPLAVGKVGDFGHFWSAGHAVAADPAQMYSADAHRPIVLGLEGGASLWNERADRVGAFFYPPPAAFWYGFLGEFDYKIAAAIQGLVTLVSVACASVCVAALSGRRLAPATVAILVLASPTCLYAYALGQNGLMTLAVASAGALALARDRDGVAGAVLSLLACKPSWTLGLGWVPLALGRWRAIVAFLVGALAAAVLAAGAFGPQRFIEYVQVAGLVSRLDRLPEYPAAHQHNLYALARSALGVGVTTDLVAVTAGLAVIGLTVWRFGGPRRPMSLEAAGAFFAAGTLANPHVHHYDMLPMCVAIAAIAAAFPATMRGRVVAGAVVAFWYVSFFVGEQLDAGFSIPAIANLLVWAWLVASSWLVAPPAVARV